FSGEISVAKGGHMRQIIEVDPKGNRLYSSELVGPKGNTLNTLISCISGMYIKEFGYKRPSKHTTESGAFGAFRLVAPAEYIDPAIAVTLGGNSNPSSNQENNCIDSEAPPIMANSSIISEPALSNNTD
ncbi:MAG: hypothetical protein MJA30_31370, partial [Cytophagales bacterium]|nr:hypothetical protein [Cytophagales bacterium]